MPKGESDARSAIWGHFATPLARQRILRQSCGVAGADWRFAVCIAKSRRASAWCSTTSCPTGAGGRNAPALVQRSARFDSSRMKAVYLVLDSACCLSVVGRVFAIPRQELAHIRLRALRTPRRIGAFLRSRCQRRPSFGATFVRREPGSMQRWMHGSRGREPHRVVRLGDLPERVRLGTLRGKVGVGRFPLSRVEGQWECLRDCAPSMAT